MGFNGSCQGFVISPQANSVDVIFPIVHVQVLHPSPHGKLSPPLRILSRKRHSLSDGGHNFFVEASFPLIQVHLLQPSAHSLVSPSLNSLRSSSLQFVFEPRNLGSKQVLKICEFYSYHNLSLLRLFFHRYKCKCCSHLHTAHCPHL